MTAPARDGEAMSAQADLFTEPAPKRETVNFYERAARAKRAFGPEWHMASWEALGDGICRVRGSALTVEPNGKRHWAKKLDTVLVTDAEVDEACAHYEAETGRCRQCFGVGQEFAGWHHIDGVRLRPCSRCHETGKPC